jgi:raffinose/stachyose/melibiose transport system permease protein
VIYRRSVRSTSASTTGAARRPATFLGLDNYRELLSDPLFYAALRHKPWSSCSALLFQLPLGMALALVVTSSLRLGAAVAGVYFLPMLMSTVAIGILWGYILNPTYGLLERRARRGRAGRLQQPWLGRAAPRCRR